MNTKTPITCQCGQRIFLRDVLQKGQFLRLFSPGFIYVKYRCSRCRRLGEKFVPQDQWLEAARSEPITDVSQIERDRLSKLGGIGLDEVIDFHFLLEQASLDEILEANE